jgi:hypothetical protein
MVAGAVSEFGQPARVYRYQRYAILVWNKNILPLLAPRCEPGGEGMKMAVFRVAGDNFQAGSCIS